MQKRDHPRCLLRWTASLVVMLCASSPLAFQESTCTSFQQENFISQPLSHQSSCHVGQTQTEPPRKSSLVQIFNKEQLSHRVSAAGSITLKSSTQLTSAIKLKKNIPILFFNVFCLFCVFFFFFFKQKWYGDKSSNNTKCRASDGLERGTQESESL